MKYNKRKYKKFIWQLLAMIFVFALLVGSFVFIVDPLQFYRKATFYTPQYSWQERYQAPGFAKNWKYDTIIVGTSMTENFLPSEVGEKLGGTVVKLSMEGSLAWQHNKIAKVAFRTGQVKKVLWGLDYFSLRSTGDNPDLDDFPDYMYDTNPFNDYKYIFNESNIETAFRVLRTSKERAKYKSSPERLNNWDKNVTYGKDKVLKSWVAGKSKEGAFGSNEDPLESVKKVFNEQILSLVKAHPETEFYFYYPPYSVLRQQLWYVTNPARYENQLEMKRYMYEQFSAYPNVKVFEFQTDSSITYDLDQYKDLSHHSGHINSVIIDEISKGTHQVTKDNVETTINLLRKQAENVVVNSDTGAIYSLDLTVNGKGTSFGTIPTTTGDTIMAPLKRYATMLGISFDYDTTSKKVTMVKGKKTAVFTVGSDVADVNGQSVKLDAPIANKEGAMAGPLVSVTELFGGTVTITDEDQYMKKVDVKL
ncbi:hypothetical protein DCC85_20720 [Paenibacillus sp. CAA11]|uniref:copper amine oxidase N-terminal domain-containing protein n=1 Tax=Paenibacillus sp. CAA11 TaxID=1532905 RepID=UPI000D338026|nr:copper amine oxidase N-terminal domain-containing protein [Paenibacillus sp. CAA11]AWB46349.1 hypothetical protein DCC85_20720 [Paenibacillus sp. CAA11]